MVKKRAGADSIEFRVNDVIVKKLEIIREYEKNKRGNDSISNAIRESILYYANKIEKNEV